MKEKKHTYTQPGKPDRPCHICGCREFWNRGWGWICQRCHPCVSGVEREICVIEEKDGSAHR